MAKKNKNFYIKEKTIELIKRYEEENELKQGEALDEIVERFFQKDSQLAKDISDSITENLSNILTRVRLGTNNADRNSQIVLELLNTMIIYQQVPRLLPTTEEENKSVALKEAEQTVKKKIENYRTKKLSSTGDK